MTTLTFDNYRIGTSNEWDEHEIVCDATDTLCGEPHTQTCRVGIAYGEQEARLRIAAPLLLTALQAYIAWDARDVDSPCQCTGPQLCHVCTLRQALVAISVAAPEQATCERPTY